MQTRRLIGAGVMNYVVEMDAGAMIHIPSFIKIGSAFKS
jgi:hypothetical protein